MRRLGSSPRSRVWRAEVSGSAVVVKQLVDGPEAADRYAREVTALRLASRVDPPVVPRLLGTGADERLLVLEYVEHQDPRGDWLVDYATALARLHSAASSDALGNLSALSGLPAWSGPDQDDIDSFLGLARTLGVDVPPGVRAELDDLAARLAGMEHNALLHGDPCPGNDLHTATGVRFIDFEQVALGNGLVELAYLRIGFPTCWCSTVPHVETLYAAEAAYRTTWQQATGTDVRGDLTDACAGWLLRGSALGQLSNGNSPLEELGRLAAVLCDVIRTRWPDLQPLPAQRPWSTKGL
ncbi:aminoglycoside phosphotransferase family protein [Kribbella sp. CA-253562]|uniref:aminoglycoside phosphotransferase family protein n=1 Tax=Kribbella sp. CA-253562 TaxID=3239942 RepID=UPI003D8F0E9F